MRHRVVDCVRDIGRPNPDRVRHHVEASQALHLTIAVTSIPRPTASSTIRHPAFSISDMTATFLGRTDLIGTEAQREDHGVGPEGAPLPHRGVLVGSGDKAGAREHGRPVVGKDVTQVARVHAGHAGNGQEDVGQGRQGPDDGHRGNDQTVALR